MSKQQEELDKLRAEQQQTTQYKAANLQEIQDLQSQGKERDPQFQQLVNKDKQLASDLFSKNAAISQKTSEIEEAKKAAVKEEVAAAGEQAKSNILATEDAELPNHATPTIDPSQTPDASNQSLDHETTERIESVQEGRGNNYQHNNNLMEVSQAQQQAREQAKGALEGKGITVDQSHEQDFDDR